MGFPGKWNKTNLNQCYLFLIKLTDQKDTYGWSLDPYEIAPGPRTHLEWPQVQWADSQAYKVTSRWSAGSASGAGGGSSFEGNELPSHQQTWKCTDPCRKTTFLLERAFWHFHVSWWEGTDRSSVKNLLVKYRTFMVSLPEITGFPCLFPL